ncbi:hypothetical protein HHI36_016347 [Cryptolaemus montrouzieri]|uniref:Uncharacterized protein n=2 Tax=Cryptolaemus montrouzieri TaxID=559131 RepID=A0ABD2NJG6_9CUCU
MSEREQRAIRKIWREKTKKHRDRVKLQITRNNPITPPASDNEDQPPLPENNIALAAKRRSEIQRKLRNKLIKKQQCEIKQLRQKVRDCQKKIRRMGKQKMTPNSKVADLLQNTTKENVEEVKKKLLFSEVVQHQLKENINLTTNDNEKKIFKKVLSGKIVKKYKVLNQINMKPIRQSSNTNKKLLDMTRKTRSDKTGDIKYPQNNKTQLDVAEVYTDSEEDVQNKMVAHTSSTHLINTKDNADTAMTVKNGDFILVEYYINNKKYRYAGVCSSDFDEEEGDVRVTFLKISNEDGTLFRIDENDMSDVKWEQILTILPVPNIHMKVFYKFPKSVDVFEK